MDIKHCDKNCDECEHRFFCWTVLTDKQIKIRKGDKNIVLSDGVIG